MVTKCIVKHCENTADEGEFVGDLCYPCHAFITTCTGTESQAYRNTEPVFDERDIGAIALVMRGYLMCLNISDFMAMIVGAWDGLAAKDKERWRSVATIIAGAVCRIYQDKHRRS